MQIQKRTQPSESSKTPRLNSAQDVVAAVINRRVPALIALVANWDLLNEAMHDVAFKLALAGEFRVVVGGNRFSFYRFPLYLGARLFRLRELMDNFLVSRAKTCFQMLDTLEHLDFDGTPLLVMDFLHSFDEDGLTTRELNRVLSDCLRMARNAAGQGPVILSIANNIGNQTLVERVLSEADHSVVASRGDQNKLAVQTELL